MTTYEDSRGHNVLFEVAIHDHVPLVKWILSKTFVSIDVLNRDNRSVISFLASNQTNISLEMIKMFVIAGEAVLNDGASTFFDLLPRIDKTTLSWMTDGGYIDEEAQNSDGESIFQRMLMGCSFQMIRFYMTKYKPTKVSEDEEDR